MNKYFHSFFVILLCIPFFSQPMNILEPTYPIFISKKPSGMVIQIPNVREIAFLGDTQLIVQEKDKRPCLINLDSKDCSYFSPPSIPFRCSLATDLSKKRVLFSREDDQARIRVYDSVSKEFVSGHIIYDEESGKYFPICFDEKNPNSILVEKGIPTSIVSYNYITQKISRENGLSEGFKDDSLQNYKYLYNARLGINGIIGQHPEGFKIYYDSPQSVYRKIHMFNVMPSSYRQRSYICAPDMSFIVYYALFNTVFNISDLPDNSWLNVDNGCYISYANGDATTESLCGNDHISIPCAMVIHPINNKVFAMMLAEDRIIHYFSSQGIFLAEQKMPISDKGKFDDEVGNAHKYLDFSANGELLAAVFPRKIAIFNVPFHVQYGMKEDKLLLIFRCLKNYQLNGNLLPRDVLRLLFNSLKY